MTKNVSRETKFLKKKPSIQLFLDASSSMKKKVREYY